MAPRSFQSQFNAYQPVPPPMRRIGLNAASGGLGIFIVRESTSRRPKRTPPQERTSRRGKGVRPAGFGEFAVLVGQGVCDGRVDAHGADVEGAERCVVSDHRGVHDALDELRPMRAYSGVTSPSQRLERYGVRTGTWSMTRRMDRHRAYARMMSA